MSRANIKFTNLHINGESQDAENHPEYVCENCSLAVAAECRNDGGRATRGFKVAFSLDGGQQHLENVEALSPGETYWAHWRHPALHYGTHRLTVDFDPQDRIREEDEFDNEYTHEFWVYGAQNVGHTVDFSDEPLAVEGNPDWAAHGWKQIDVGFILKDAMGRPLEGYNFFVKFYGPEQEESLGTPTVGDSNLDAAGLLRCPNVYLKSSGYVHVLAIPTAGGPREGGELMEQTHAYTLAENATSLSFKLKQKGGTIKVTAGNERQASRQATIELGGKVNILDVVELGATGSEQTGTSNTDSQSLEWEVTYAFPILEFHD